MVTTPRGWMRSLDLVRLVAAGDSASGWSREDDPSFMIARQQEAPESLATVPQPADGTRREAGYAPAVRTEAGPAFMAQLAEPAARFFSMAVDGDPASTFVLDSLTDSSANSPPPTEAGRSLKAAANTSVDAIESTVATWEEHGAPGTTAPSSSVRKARRRPRCR